MDHGERSILVRGMRSESSGDTEAWFLIRRTSNGSMEPSEVFKTASAKLPGDSVHWEVSCAQIGSSLYVLGGRTPELGKMYVFSDSVRRIDLMNPGDGWKPCKPLPYRCGLVRHCAAGDMIYMFPILRSDPDNPGGFVYRVSEQKGYPLPTPLGLKENETWELLFLDAYDTGKGHRGLFTQFEDPRLLEKYDTDKKLWKQLDNFKVPNPLPVAVPPGHAIWKNKLYLSFCDWHWADEEETPVTNILNAYDVGSDLPLLGKNGEGITLQFSKVKNFEWKRKPMCLVAVSDNKLCYVWHEYQSSVNQLEVKIATVEVSASGLSAFVTSEEELVLNVRTIENIIPFDDLISRMNE